MLHKYLKYRLFRIVPCRAVESAPMLRLKPIPLIVRFHKEDAVLHRADVAVQVLESKNHDVLLLMKINYIL